MDWGGAPRCSRGLGSDRAASSAIRLLTLGGGVEWSGLRPDPRLEGLHERLDSINAGDEALQGVGDGGHELAGGGGSEGVGSGLALAARAGAGEEPVGVDIEAVADGGEELDARGLALDVAADGLGVLAGGLGEVPVGEVADNGFKPFMESGFGEHRNILSRDAAGATPA